MRVAVIDSGFGMVNYADALSRVRPDTELVLAVEPQALTVPAAAVVTGQEGPIVFVVTADRKAEKRAVKVNRTVNGLAVLDAGVQAGETVVIDGQMRLVPGAPVEPKDGGGSQGAAR